MSADTGVEERQQILNRGHCGTAASTHARDFAIACQDYETGACDRRIAGPAPSLVREGINHAASLDAVHQPIRGNHFPGNGVGVFSRIQLQENVQHERNKSSSFLR